VSVITYAAKREIVNDNAPFVAPFGDLGNGQVSIVLQRGIGIGTFVRATAAAARLGTGLWKLDIASGIPRSHYLPDLAYGGYLAEGAATQLVTPAAAVRDMTNAAWVKTTMTTAKTSVGIDGVASACTRMTATGGNATALFTLVAAASSRTYSCYIKRITGVGNVQLTQDNGGSWTTVALPLAGFNLVQLNASQLNAVIGIRLVTSGDAIDVDCNQFEAGALATTPIPAAGTRNADQLTYAFSGNALAATGTAYVETSAERPSGTTGTFTMVYLGAATGILSVPTGSADTVVQATDGTNTVTKTGLTSAVNSVRKRAASWGAGGLVVTGDNLAVATGSFDGDAGSTSVALGFRAGSNDNYLYGTLKNVRLYKLQQANALLQQTTDPAVDYARPVGTLATLEFKVEQVDRKVKVKRSEQQPSGGGAPEVMLERQEVTVDVLTEILSEASQVPQFREFFASVSAGELFTFDPYGTIAVPVDPRQAMLASADYDEQRVMTTMQQRIPFTARLLS
jgi:hypothetical protein